MEVWTCDKCETTFDQGVEKCFCGNDVFNVDTYSDCCGASLIGELGLCSDCKEHCI